MNRTFVFTISSVLLAGRYLDGTHTSRCTTQVCHTGKSLKRHCCFVVAASKFTASYGWWYLLADTVTQQQSAKQQYYIFSISIGLIGSTSRKAPPWLLVRFREFEGPEHAPRSPAWTHTCTVVYRRPPLRALQPRAREKTLGRRSKKKCTYSGKNLQFCTFS